MLLLIDVASGFPKYWKSASNFSFCGQIAYYVIIITLNSLGRIEILLVLGG